MAVLLVVFIKYSKNILTKKFFIMVGDTEKNVITEAKKNLKIKKKVKFSNIRKGKIKKKKVINII